MALLNGADALAIEPFTVSFVPAGFWRRFLAWLADIVILAVPSYVLGGLFYHTLTRIGPYGRFIGLPVMVAYFGILNSELGGGQTAAKMFFDIRVLASTGRLISFSKSLLRSVLVAGPYVLNGWTLPIFQHNPLAAWFQALVVIALGGSIIYMMVFNRRTRQGMHDVLCDTYVEKIAAPAMVPVPRVPRLHFVVPVILLVLGVLSPLVAVVAHRVPWFAVRLAPLEELQHTLSEDPRFFGVGINHNVIYGPGATRQVLTVQAWFVGDPSPEDRQAAIDSLARVAVSQYKNIDEVNDVAIVVCSAFDLGIASWTYSSRDVRSIDEWRKRILSVASRDGRHES